MSKRTKSKPVLASLWKCKVCSVHWYKWSNGTYSVCGTAGTCCDNDPKPPLEEVVFASTSKSSRKALQIAKKALDSAKSWLNHGPYATHKTLAWRNTNAWKILHDALKALAKIR